MVPWHTLKFALLLSCSLIILNFCALPVHALNIGIQATDISATVVCFSCSSLSFSFTFLFYFISITRISGRKDFALTKFLGHRTCKASSLHIYTGRVKLEVASGSSDLQLECFTLIFIYFFHSYPKFYTSKWYFDHFTGLCYVFVG